MSGPSPAASDAPIPLARPALSEQARTAVLDVLGSSRLSRGPYLEQFEARMADRCGTAYAVGVSSGTAALLCIVAALDLEPGAEVLTTPFSFVASTNVLLYEDLRPRFVDIDPRRIRPAWSTSWLRGEPALQRESSGEAASSA